ncbi:MAG: phosphoribosyltransferase [Planctomycetota bacterium]
MDASYIDRNHAGRLLAAALQRRLAHVANLLVIGLPRGGVPVAVEVARALDAPLDVLLVRKLGVPGHEELAFGAVASNGAVVLNQDVMHSTGLSREAAQQIVRREQGEIERRARQWRPTHPAVDVAGRPVVVVDDGLATGATMLAAVGMLRQQHASRIIVAVPVAPASTVARLKREADEVICLSTPRDFFGVGQYYDNFAQLDDDDVLELLDQDTRRSLSTASAPSGRTERDEWSGLARAFGDQHRGWLVNARTRSGIRTGGALVDVRYPGEGAGECFEFEILGTWGTQVVSIADPGSVRVLHTADGRDAGLAVQGADDAIELHFRSPARPREVDGIAPSELPPAPAAGGSHRHLHHQHRGSDATRDA